jgi:TPP-dependent pyruvate/acetoin dehydrogenase alpha subunit
MVAEVTAEVEAAVERAEAAPYLSLEEARRHVYAG